MKPDMVVLRFGEDHNEAGEEPQHLRKSSSNILLKPGFRLLPHRFL